MRNRRNIIQLLSVIPFISIGKLKALETPSHMKDVVNIGIEMDFEIDQVFGSYQIQAYEIPETKITVKIEYKCGRVYEFVGNDIKFYNDKTYPYPLQSKNRQYFQALDYQVNLASVIVIFDCGKVVVTKL